MNFSICIITKNESAKLKRCLKSLSALRQEIIVADTGSTDDTRQVIEECKASYRAFDWCDDFSAARNFVANEASNDWILMVDSDEYLMEQENSDNYQLMQDAIRPSESDPHLIGRTLIINETRSNGELQLVHVNISRFYNRRYFHYEGRIHEQLVPTDKKSKIIKYNMQLPFYHDGYVGDDQHIQAKTIRNINLLKKVLKESPDDCYLLYQIGQSYFLMGDYAEAESYFSNAFSLGVDTKSEYAQMLVENYGYCLIKNGKADIALGLSDMALEFSSNADFHFMMGFVYMNNAMFKAAIESFNKAATCPEGKTKGTNGFLSYYNIGVIYEVLGDFTNARIYYEKSGEYPKARERLRTIFP